MDDNNIRELIHLATVVNGSKMESILDTLSASAPGIGNAAVDAVFASKGFNGAGDADLKTLLAAAVSIAQAKGFDGVPMTPAITTAVISDNVVTAAKTAYQLVDGMVSEDKVAKLLADKAAVMCDRAASLVTPHNVRLGLNAVADTLSAVYPPVKTVKPFIAAISHVVTPMVHRAIATAKPVVSSIVRSTVKSAVTCLKKGGKKVISRLYALLK